jgi:hypothetical protein
MKELKGTIKNCIISTTPYSNGRIHCNLIQGKGTTAIVTSKALEIYTLGGEMFVETCNSIYKIEGDLSFK